MGLLLAAWVYVVYALARAAEEYVVCLLMRLWWTHQVFRAGLELLTLSFSGQGALTKWGDGFLRVTNTSVPLTVAVGVSAHPFCGAALARCSCAPLWSFSHRGSPFTAHIYATAEAKAAAGATPTKKRQ